jgi:hypothetical protein
MNYDELIKNEENLITNFNKEDLYLYEKAIEKYDALYIDNKAYDGLGNRIKNSYALRTNDIDNMANDFWNVYYEIENLRNEI